MLLRLFAALAIVVLLAIPRTSWAQKEGLEKARAHIEAVEFEKAITVLKSTLKAGGNSSVDIIEIYKLLGEVSVGVNKPKEARVYFASLVALDSSASFPELTSPKITEVFDLAKASVDGELEVTSELQEGTRAIVLEITSDPLSMVTGMTVTFLKEDGSAGVAQATGSGTIEVVLPSSARTEVRAHATDQYGNLLRSFDIDDLPAVGGGGGGGGGGVTGPVDGTPVYQKWWLWAGVVGALTITGGFFGLQAQSAQDDLDEILADSENRFFSAAKEAQDRGERNALLANITFVAAGAAAITGGVLVYLGMRGKGGQESQSQTGMMVTPTVDGHSVGAAVTWSF